MTFAPARKLYRIGLLFTHKTSEFGAISVAERNWASPRRSLMWRVKYRIGVHTITESFSSQREKLSEKVWPLPKAQLKRRTSQVTNPMPMSKICPRFSIIGIRFLAFVVRRFTLGLDNKIIHLRGKKKSFHHTLYFLVSQARDNTTVHAYSTSFNTKLALTL